MKTLSIREMRGALGQLDQLVDPLENRVAPGSAPGSRPDSLRILEYVGSFCVVISLWGP